MESKPPWEESDFILGFQLRLFPDLGEVVAEGPPDHLRVQAWGAQNMDHGIPHHGIPYHTIPLYKMMGKLS